VYQLDHNLYCGVHHFDIVHWARDVKSPVAVTAMEGTRATVQEQIECVAGLVRLLTYLYVYVQ
jgi:hypothetical protein